MKYTKQIQNLIKKQNPQLSGYDEETNSYTLTATGAHYIVQCRHVERIEGMKDIEKKAFNRITMKLIELKEEDKEHIIEVTGYKNATSLLNEYHERIQNFYIEKKIGGLIPSTKLAIKLLKMFVENDKGINVYYNEDFTLIIENGSTEIAVAPCIFNDKGDEDE